MVRAIEAAGLRGRVGDQGAALFGGAPLQPAVGLALARAHDHDLRRDLGAGQEAVHVDVDHRRLQRPDRVGGIVFRAQQARLLGRPGRKQHRPLGRRPRLEQPRQFDQPGHARRIVDGPVIDVVAVLGRRPAEGVPVGPVHHRLFGMQGTGNAGQDVAALDPVGDLAEIDRHRHPVQRHRREFRRPRRLAQGRIVQPRIAEQGLRLRPLDPALGRDPLGLGIGAHDVEFGRGRRTLQRAPAIAGARRVVDHQHRRRPLARRLLEFVGPAAVEGHGIAVEPPRHRMPLGGTEVGVVDDDQQDLALQVHALEVVPLPLGRVDAIAGEDDRRVGQGDVVYRPVAGEQHLRAPLQRPRLAAGADRDRRRPVLPRPPQLRRLHPRSVRPARLQPQGLELADDIVDRLLLTRRRHAPALELVRGEDPHDLVQPRAFGVLGEGGGGRQEGRNGGGEEKAVLGHRQL